MNQKPVCAECGGSNLVFDGMIEWDERTQRWSIIDPYDHRPYCQDCNEEVREDWVNCNSNELDE